MTKHYNRQVLGIARSPRFSPNSTQRDNTIFQAVADGLRHEGFSVDTCSEDDFSHCASDTFVFSMARDENVLQKLAEAEQQGMCIVNSPTAILSHSRLHLFTLLAQEGIPVAPFCRFDCSHDVPFPFWLKRSIGCAQHAADVQFIDNAEKLKQALCYYRQKQIDEIFCCQHLAGDLIKFYGVAGTPFFYAYYPTAENDFSKFGLEAINGTPTGYPIDLKAMKAIADRAAFCSQIIVYGGDAIVAPDGSFRIIDFNDWPSFSRCWREAAQAIVEKIKMMTLSKTS